LVIAGEIDGHGEIPLQTDDGLTPDMRPRHCFKAPAAVEVGQAADKQAANAPDVPDASYRCTGTIGIVGIVTARMSSSRRGSSHFWMRPA
jgi:hypothetical protein